MGNKKSVFTKQELEEYVDLTYFTRKEILMAFKKFKSLDPEKITENKNARLPMETILAFPELKVNPFGDRICMTFSSSKDGDINFEDFLDMMSALSEEAPLTLKAEYVFRIFDIDGDDMLGPEDIEEVIRRLVGDEVIPARDISRLVDLLTKETDLDDDGMLSFAEFELAVSKSQHFVESFTIRLFHG